MKPSERIVEIYKEIKKSHHWSSEAVQFSFGEEAILKYLDESYNFLKENIQEDKK